MTDPVYMFEAVKRAAVSRLTAITNDVLDNEARWVLTDFLKATRVWKRNLDVALVAGQTDYDLGIEDYESASGIEQAEYDGYPVRLGIFGMNYATTGRPSMVGLDNDRTLRVYPTPAAGATGAVSVLVWLSLLAGTDQPPPDVVRPYHDVLLDGLLMRCFSMPDRPWTNMRLAPTHAMAYEGGKSTVRRELDSGRSHGAQFMRIPRF